MMCPTNYLRWIEQTEKQHLPQLGKGVYRFVQVKRLQQWWIRVDILRATPLVSPYMSRGEGEWRDVPVGIETGVEVHNE